MRQPLVAGNWKLNGTLSSISELISGIKEQLPSVNNAELAVCPPYIYLSHVQKLLEGSDISLGAQDCSDQESGAYTGEVAAAMVSEFACNYVIIGHSERRHVYGDTNEKVATKFAHVVKNRLTPILCVGETLQEREEGHTEVVISKQINAVLDLFGVEAFKNAVIAYEPVWAIGTGQVATPSQAQEVHEEIRLTLDAQNKDIAANMRILYGGSMKPDNAKELLQQPDIDGGLIGGAALKAEDFIGIALAAN
ncbi:MAG: triose-phosphate isomerase [Gammaproteobacteria bacterium]